jgi:hypothetical protein
MKKFISMMIATALLGSTTAVCADPAFRTPTEYTVKTTLVLPTISFPTVPLQPGEADPGEVLFPMKRYDKAPFSGVLLSPRATAKIVADYSTLGKQIEIEKTKVVAEEKAKCQLDKDNLNADIDRLKKEKTIISDTKDAQINDLIKQVKSDNGFFSSSAFVILMSGLSATAGFYVGYLAFHK